MTTCGECGNVLDDFENWHHPKCSSQYSGMDICSASLTGASSYRLAAFEALEGGQYKPSIREVLEQYDEWLSANTAIGIEHIGWAVQGSDGSWDIKPGKVMPTGIRLTLLKPVYVRNEAGK